MQVEVDQSNRVENPGDTVLAFSDGEGWVIRIPAAIKREALAHLRRRGKSTKLAVLYVFAAGLFLLLQGAAAQLTLVTIDEEYPGHESTIKGMLLRMSRRAGVHFDPGAIAFGRVGKSSPAHGLAIKVYLGKREPDHVVTFDELLSLLGQEK